MINVPSKALRRGEAIGGPLAGEILSTDYPKGIIVVDRIKHAAWVYDFSVDPNRFVCRSDQAEILEWRQELQYNIRRAMEENNYEVRSHPRAGEDY
jgi:hypothetical protein